MRKNSGDEEMIWELQMIYEDVSMDAQYMDAVKNNDMKIVQRMVDIKSKNSGYDLEAWHGSPEKGFTKFSMDSPSRPNTEGKAFFFAGDEEFASQFSIIPTGEKIQKFVRDDESGKVLGSYEEDVYKEGEIRRFFLKAKLKNAPEDSLGKREEQTILDDAKMSGYDGVRFEARVLDFSDSFAVFYPNQIKLADPVTYDDNSEIIPLSKRFNPNTDDIRY
jgi:hypothetical protein